MRTLYRVFLRLFLPRSLTDVHGDEMEALFAEQVAFARGRGRLAGVREGFEGLANIVTRAPLEHWRRSGTHSTQRKEHPVQSLLVDIRYAFRSFARQRGATLTIVATLTLAVAASITVFAVLDATFRRPFPFRDAERLVSLNERAPRWNLPYTGINYFAFTRWQQRAAAFESMAMWEDDNVNLGFDDNSERVRALSVSHSMADVLGDAIQLGRNFTAAEDVPGGPPVALISDRLWKERFGRDSGVLGNSIRINSRPHSIVGVLSPEASGYPDYHAVWIPFGGDSTETFSFGGAGLGRLKPGVTLEQAQQSLTDAHAPVWAQYDSARIVSPIVEAHRARFIASFITPGKAVGVGAALVFLIACANVAGSMLARSIARRREVGIRVALGASASRIVRQLLTESLVLSSIAGVLGTLVAYAGIDAIVRYAGEFIPPWAHPQLDLPAVAFAVITIGTAALLFGLAPALQLKRHVSQQTGAAAARAAGSVPERRMLNVLVVGEVALAAVLLVGGGLLLRAYQKLQNTEPGFETRHVASFSLSVPTATYTTGSDRLAMFARVIDRMRAIPGVIDVGAVTCLPLGCHHGSFYRAEGEPPPKDGAADPVTLNRVATPGYFDAMNIGLVKGRFFHEGEGSAARYGRVAVVNEEFAKLHWPDADPIGKRFSAAGDTSHNWATVVGVVKDARHYGLVNPMIPGIYMSTTSLSATAVRNTMGFAVRTRGDASALLPAIRAAAREIDPEIPLFQLQTMSTALDRSMLQQRVIAMSMGVMSVIALSLALGGIYAVLSYVVGRRRREIAIRMALGAKAQGVLQLILRQGLLLTVIGLAIGVPAALAAARAISTILIGISPTDPATYLIAVGIVVLTAGTAALIPAMYAARTDAKAVLRE